MISGQSIYPLEGELAVFIPSLEAPVPVNGLGRVIQGSLVVDSVLSDVLLEDSAHGLVGREAAFERELSHFIAPVAFDQAAGSGVHVQLGEFHRVGLFALVVKGLPGHRRYIKDML